MIHTHQFKLEKSLQLEWVFRSPHAEIHQELQIPSGKECSRTFNVYTWMVMQHTVVQHTVDNTHMVHLPGEVLGTKTPGGSQDVTLHNSHSPLHTEHWTLKTEHSTLNTEHWWTLIHDQWTLTIAYWTLNKKHWTLNTEHCILNTEHYTLNTTHWKIHTKQWILNTLY